MRILDIRKSFNKCIFIFCLLSVVSSTAAQQWQELKSEHFIVYFMQEKSFAKNTLNRAENYYKKIAGELGYARHSGFWQWDKRVKIYIYPDRDAYRSYLEAHGFAVWSVGMADYKNKEIRSLSWSGEFLDSILPHEITHLIFRDHIGQRNIPIWIDEGVAQWQEKGKRQIVKIKMKQLLKIHDPIPIERLMTINIGQCKNEAIVELFYVESVSLIDFLITQYRADNFVFFFRQLSDGKDINEALMFDYPLSIRKVEQLETKWLEYLGREQ